MKNIRSLLPLLLAAALFGCGRQGGVDPLRVVSVIPGNDQGIYYVVRIEALPSERFEIFDYDTRLPIDTTDFAPEYILVRDDQFYAVDADNGRNPRVYDVHGEQHAAFDGRVLLLKEEHVLVGVEQQPGEGGDDGQAALVSLGRDARVDGLRGFSAAYRAGTLGVLAVDDSAAVFYDLTLRPQARLPRDVIVDPEGEIVNLKYDEQTHVLLIDQYTLSFAQPVDYVREIQQLDGVWYVLAFVQDRVLLYSTKASLIDSTDFEELRTYTIVHHEGAFHVAHRDFDRGTKTISRDGTPTDVFEQYFTSRGLYTVRRAPDGYVLEHAGRQIACGGPPRRTDQWLLFEDRNPSSPAFFVEAGDDTVFLDAGLNEIARARGQVAAFAKTFRRLVALMYDDGDHHFVEIDL